MLVKPYGILSNFKQFLSSLHDRGMRYIFHGTQEEWDALSAEEKDRYSQAEIEDQSGISAPILRNVFSAAGGDIQNLALFVANMLTDIGMQSWAAGTYVGRFSSTKSGAGDFGAWLGTYQLVKADFDNYGATVHGNANNCPFVAMWSGSAWLVKVNERYGIISGTTDGNGNLVLTNFVPPASQIDRVICDKSYIGIPFTDTNTTNQSAIHVIWANTNNQVATNTAITAKVWYTEHANMTY